MTFMESGATAYLSDADTLTVAEVARFVRDPVAITR